MQRFSFPKISSWLLLVAMAALPACQSSEQGAAENRAPAEERSAPPAAAPRVCTVDTFHQPEAPVANKVDVLFVMDNSESMNRHWQLMANKIDHLIREFPAGSDLRFAVILGTVEKYYGRLYSAPGVPLVLDGTKLSSAQVSSYLRRTFTEALKYTDRTGAGEALFYSLYYAATTRAEEIQTRGFFRADAALQVMLMSDDAEIGTKYPSRQPWNLPPKCNYNHHESVRKSHYLPRGISTDTTFQALRRLKGDHPLSTNAFVNITKEDILVDNDPHAACIYDSPGYGYFDMVKKSGGVLYSIHQDRADGLARTGRYMAARLPVLHDFRLSKPADQVDAATIEAKVDGEPKPHTYNALTNSVRIEDAGRNGSEISIRHCEPEQRQEWSIVGFAGEAGRTEAALRWQTPELATFGRVLYGTDRESLTGSADGAQATSHGVTVAGLVPGTQYYFQAVSWDEYGVEKRSEILSLATQPDWELGPVTGEASRNSVSLEWDTSYPTLGHLLWGSSPQDLGNSTPETAAGEPHFVVVEGLEPNTVYYFQAVSRDSFGLVKASEVMELRTVADWTIVGFAGEAGRNGATLRWDTPDYPTTGKVMYGFSPDSMSQRAVDFEGVESTHRVDVAGLQPATTYFFQAISQDDLGAVKRSQVISLRTAADWQIGGLSSIPAETSLKIEFRTVGYPTEGKILWGLSANALTETTAAANGTEHGAELTGLAPDTLYYFQAVAVDDFGVEKRSEVVAARTLAEVPPLPDWAIHAFEGTAAAQSIALSWNTDYPTTGRIFYGTSPEHLDGAVDAEGASLEHAMNVPGLQPDTLYYFQVQAADDLGQEQLSAVISVRTLSVPAPSWKIQGFDGATTATDATLIWQTPGALTRATVRVGLRADDLSFRTVEVSDFKSVHLAVVDGLEPETTYYFQVSAADEQGAEQVSGLLMKRTKAP